MDNKLESLSGKNKLFYRWLYNEDKEFDKDYWETPQFLKIKNKKTENLSICRK